MDFGDDWATIKFARNDDGPAECRYQCAIDTGREQPCPHDSAIMQAVIVRFAAPTLPELIDQLSQPTAKG